MALTDVRIRWVEEGIEVVVPESGGWERRCVLTRIVVHRDEEGVVEIEGESLGEVSEDAYVAFVQRHLDALGRPEPLTLDRNDEAVAELWLRHPRRLDTVLQFEMMNFSPEFEALGPIPVVELDPVSLELRIAASDEALLRDQCTFTYAPVGPWVVEYDSDRMLLKINSDAFLNATLAVWDALHAQIERYLGEPYERHVNRWTYALGAGRTLHVFFDH